MQSDRPRGNRRSARGGRPRQVHRIAQEGEQEEEWPLPIVVVVRRGALARLEEFPERVILLGVPDPAAPIDVFDQLVLIQVPIKHICVVKVEFLNEPLEHGMMSVCPRDGQCPHTTRRDRSSHRRLPQKAIAGSGHKSA